MTLRLLHISDLHFGGRASIPLVEAVEQLIPHLRPDAIVVSGDLSQRARHGELQRARAFVVAATKTAPVYVLPGNHDVSWWWRPLGPLGRGLLYRNYRRYLGGDLTPTLTVAGRAVIAGVLTADGAAWGSWSWHWREWAAKGHLPKAEYLRVRRIFADATPELVRVLVVHHNVLRGRTSRVRGLAHARRAAARIVASGADVVLCGHDHEAAVHLLDGQVVVSTAGTLSTRLRCESQSFNLVIVGPDRTSVTVYRWDTESARFLSSEPRGFARPNFANDSG